MHIVTPNYSVKYEIVKKMENPGFDDGASRMPSKHVTN
jgi:hypothetical protein